MTAQVSEILMLDGKAVRLCSLPLKPFLERSGIDLGWGGSSGCWRGYTGKWELREDRLYLLELNRFPAPPIDLLSRVFPGASEPVFAYWFSGTLRIPKGDILEYQHIGFASTYESDLFLTIENGLLMGRTVRKNRRSETGDDPVNYGIWDAKTTPRYGLIDKLFQYFRIVMRR